MHCLQPKTRPEVPAWLAEHYPNGKVRKARIQHFCDGRVTSRCVMTIEPGDYYFEPGDRHYGALVQWCLHCAGMRQKEDKQ